MNGPVSRPVQALPGVGAGSSCAGPYMGAEWHDMGGETAAPVATRAPALPRARARGRRLALDVMSSRERRANAGGGSRSYGGGVQWQLVEGWSRPRSSDRACPYAGRARDGERSF